MSKYSLDRATVQTVNRKKLHKIRKQWVVVGASALLMLAGGAVAGTHTTHAANINGNSNNNTVTMKPQQDNKAASQPNNANQQPDSGNINTAKASQNNSGQITKMAKDNSNQNSQYPVKVANNNVQPNSNNKVASSAPKLNMGKANNNLDTYQGQSLNKSNLGQSGRVQQYNAPTVGVPHTNSIVRGIVNYSSPTIYVALYPNGDFEVSGAHTHPHGHLDAYYIYPGTTTIGSQYNTYVTKMTFNDVHFTGDMADEFANMPNMKYCDISNSTFAHNTVGSFGGLFMNDNHLQLLRVSSSMNNDDSQPSGWNLVNFGHWKDLNNGDTNDEDMANGDTWGNMANPVHNVSADIPIEARITDSTGGNVHYANLGTKHVTRPSGDDADIPLGSYSEPNCINEDVNAYAIPAFTDNGYNDNGDTTHFMAQGSRTLSHDPILIVNFKSRDESDNINFEYQGHNAGHTSKTGPSGTRFSITSNNGIDPGYELANDGSQSNIPLDGQPHTVNVKPIHEIDNITYVISSGQHNGQHDGGFTKGGPSSATNLPSSNFIIGSNPENLPAHYHVVNPSQSIPYDGEPHNVAIDPDTMNGSN